jgi:SAM-dependent methyltransferase
MDARFPPSAPLPAPSAFDQHASRYAEVWGEDPVARAQRDVVWAALDRVLPPGARVLDGGCGVGLDARWLLDRGHVVVGLDASRGMLAEARGRAPEALLRLASLDAPGALDGLGVFDAALLDFGVINCLDLPGAARALSAALRPGAPLIVVTMPRLNPTWTLSALVRGRPGAALERLAPELEVPVEGGRVRTRYLGARAVSRAMKPWFALEDQAGLGFLLPPPGTRWPATRIHHLARLEDRLRRLPLLRAMGDHLLLLLRRLPTEPG